MTKYWSIWCEWDIGQEGTVFSSLELARNWCVTNENLSEAMDYEDDIFSLEDLEHKGLITFRNNVEIDP